MTIELITKKVEELAKSINANDLIIAEKNTAIEKSISDIKVIDEESLKKGIEDSVQTKLDDLQISLSGQIESLAITKKEEKEEGPDMEAFTKSIFGHLSGHSSEVLQDSLEKSGVSRTLAGDNAVETPKPYLGKISKEIADYSPIAGLVESVNTGKSIEYEAPVMLFNSVKDYASTEKGFGANFTYNIGLKKEKAKHYRAESSITQEQLDFSPMRLWSMSKEQLFSSIARQTASDILGIKITNINPNNGKFTVEPVLTVVSENKVAGILPNLLKSAPSNVIESAASGIFSINDFFGLKEDFDDESGKGAVALMNKAAYYKLLLSKGTSNDHFIMPIGDLKSGVAMTLDGTIIIASQYIPAEYPVFIASWKEAYVRWETHVKNRFLMDHIANVKSDNSESNNATKRLMFDTYAGGMIKSPKAIRIAKLKV